MIFDMLARDLLERSQNFDQVSVLPLGDGLANKFGQDARWLHLEGRGRYQQAHHNDNPCTSPPKSQSSPNRASRVRHP